jgi:hypothetical protein
METLIANHDWYIAVAYSTTGEQVGFKSFVGDTAEADAREHLEHLKNIPYSREAWLAKLDHDQWKFADMVRRSDNGDWAPTAALL